MCPTFLAGVVGGGLARVVAGECCVKLKDYELPQHRLDDGLDQEDLKQYSLKNFDLEAYQLTQKQLVPDPIPAPCDPYLLKQQTDNPSPLAAAQEAPSPNQLNMNAWSSTGEQPNEPSFSHDPKPVQTELNQLVLDPCDVQFGPHFNLQTVSYSPLSPAQQWKIPRWVVAMLGLFFGSAAVLMIAFCVVLLRDPKAAPAAQLAVPTAPVATTSVAPAQPTSSSPIYKAPGDATRAASAPDRETTRGSLADRAAVRHSGPATADLMHDDSALGHRIVVSRHPSVVRRQIYGPRGVVSGSTSSSGEPQETETASRRPPQDDLDKLLGESSL
jgi:hypothetical protein